MGVKEAIGLVLVIVFVLASVYFGLAGLYRYDSALVPELVPTLTPAEEAEWDRRLKRDRYDFGGVHNLYLYDGGADNVVLGDWLVLNLVWGEVLTVTFGGDFEYIAPDKLVVRR